MAEQEQSEILAKIKKVQENIAVVIGTFGALTLCIYFFTYAMLVDKGLSGLLWVQGLSAIAILLVLIYLKQVSFLFARIWLGRKPGFKEAFSVIQTSRPESS